MAHTIASIRTVAIEEYEVSEENLKHFKAGANAAWSNAYRDADGNYDLDKAEEKYETKHNLDGYGDAARAFTYGWCWSAAN
jgi:hypothetical protein